MDEEPIEVGAAQTNQETADGFLSILETVQRHMGQLQACMDKQESRTTTGTELSLHLGLTEHRQYCGPRTQMRKGRWTWTPTTAPTKNWRDVVNSRPANLRIQKDESCLDLPHQLL